ncbi:MAG: hypothetical protein KGJ80_13410 [Chloroflexota bacterium]|nr:hypothetical protein [Chloroflexota bacterium]
MAKSIRQWVADCLIDRLPCRDIIVQKEENMKAQERFSSTYRKSKQFWHGGATCHCERSEAIPLASVLKLILGD